MSLFGDKCVRCGEPTRDTYENKPTCTPCRDELELALAQASEVKRACPVHGGIMQKEIAHGVIIDRCAVCQGVWLDPGELEGMNHDVANEVWKALAYGRPLG